MAMPHYWRRHLAWQRRVLDGPDGERLWRYWRETLAGKLPVRDLPFARPRLVQPALSDASHFFALDAVEILKPSRPEAFTRHTFNVR